MNMSLIASLIDTLISTRAEEQGLPGRCIGIYTKRNFIFITSSFQNPSGSNAVTLLWEATWRHKLHRHFTANLASVKPGKTEVWNEPRSHTSRLQNVWSYIHPHLWQEQIPGPALDFLALMTRVSTTHFLCRIPWVSACLGAPLSAVHCVLLAQLFYGYGTRAHCRLL